MKSSPEIEVSIRLNPFKECDLSHLPIADSVPWSPYGAYLKSRPSFTLDPLFHAGAYYVQDASAMFVGYVLRKVIENCQSRKVLDLCAAPGGKSTDAVASLREAFGQNFILVSNEVIRQRAGVLQDNMAIWGDPNVVVCSSDPKEFSRLKGYFDLVIADVPCSGEGMFRKSENARNMWSEDNVALCSARQKRIVGDVWDALSPGGVMIYSTCTFNEDENDGNVEWICDNFGAEVIDIDADFPGFEKTRTGWLLRSGVVRGEGQFCAAVRKTGNGGREARLFPDEAATSFFDRGGEIFALPPFLADQMSFIGPKKLNVLSAGVHSFTIKGRDKIPCADLALSTLLDPEDFPSVELSREDALHFLHKDALVLHDAPQGYVVVTFFGLPLGFVKNLGSRANNLHPSSRRILMNI